MDIGKESLKKHYEWNGKIEVVTRCPLETREDIDNWLNANSNTN